MAAVRRALLDHLVLFFRDQDVTPAEQLAFASGFGTPVIPWAVVPGPEEPTSTPYFNVLEDNADSPPKADFWHTDVAFVPPRPTSPSCHGGHAPRSGATPPGSASTPSTRRSRRPCKRWCPCSTSTSHLGEPFRRAVVDMQGEEEYQRIAAATPVIRHPLVRIHPETGRRALFMCGAFMEGICGMAPEGLRRAARPPAFQAGRPQPGRSVAMASP